MDFGNVNVRRESRVPAVVAPICIEDFNLRAGWISTFSVKIVPDALQVLPAHCEAFKSHNVINGHNVIGRGVIRVERVVFIELCFAGFNGVDEVLLDGHEVADLAVEDVDLRCPYQRPETEKESRALFGGVGSLVVLSGKILDGQRVIRVIWERGQYVVGERFGKN